MSEYGEPTANRTVPVAITNWTDHPAKPRIVSKTTVRTYVLDGTATGITTGLANIQICDYEPSRVRILIQPMDQAIALTTEVPRVSPDTSTAALAPQGEYIPPVATKPYPTEKFGPDAFWINTLGATTTRVTVVKEYC